MAKVIRSRWVYRPEGKWHRYLPRRNDAVKEFDYVKRGASLQDFAVSLPEEEKPQTPPKLWMAWLYRDLAGEPKWTKKYVENLFGADYKVGRMEVFRNSELINEELWKVKHLIELRPVTFPKGEPTEEDVYTTRLSPDGTCEIVPNAPTPSEEHLQLFDKSRQWTRRELGRDLAKKYHGYKNLFEADVYTNSNIIVAK
ncbi:unnamed protein product [Caenorhabditis auriculariae]|uniref:39S ribosomal protein L30, mitochondrial n=1 Tax=Caenorhabditis auriculariae TaxID=2777116 RepID=A0A8S1GYH8_9PELO|nr:unnamed protein product [Caenorhabditis auriculariae]